MVGMEGGGNVPTSLAGKEDGKGGRRVWQVEKGKEGEGYGKVVWKRRDGKGGEVERRVCQDCKRGKVGMEMKERQDKRKRSLMNNMAEEGKGEGIDVE